MDLKFIFVCEEFESGSCHLESSSSFGKAFHHAVPRENVSRFVKKSILPSSLEAELDRLTKFLIS